MALARFAELTAPQVRSLAAEGAVALWPIGSTEQHGDHLVTGFDLASATAVCERAAAATSAPVVLLPGLALGSSDHWLPLGATLSLRPATLIAVLGDVIRSLADSGFDRVVIVNGHAGNAGAIATVTGDAALTGIRIESVSYWTLVDAARLADACVADQGGIGHAGEVETSIALALGGGLLGPGGLPGEPGLALAPGAPGGPGGGLARAPRPLDEAPGGVYGDPTVARAELGALVLDQAATALAEALA
jgi:creatinine amidohydrolase